MNGKNVTLKSGTDSPRGYLGLEILLYMLPISLGPDVFKMFVCALAQQNEITGTEEPSVLSHNQSTVGRSHPAL